MSELKLRPPKEKSKPKSTVRSDCATRANPRAESAICDLAEMGRSLLRPYKSKRKPRADLKVGHYKNTDGFGGQRVSRNRPANVQYSMAAASVV